MTDDTLGSDGVATLRRVVVSTLILTLVTTSQAMFTVCRALEVKRSHAARYWLNVTTAW